MYKRQIIYWHEPNRPLVIDAQLIESVKKALKRISFDALNLKEPQIQKISINLPVIKDLNREFGISIKALTEFGLVNLVLEMGDITQHSLFFTHQSFQEFLAAQYISEGSERLEAVINEMWSPKWREVIKFLAGIRGQEIVEKIYSQEQDNDNEDNIIHSRLFLAAECLAEVREARRELKEEINQKLKELVRIEPFRFDAIIASGFLGDITSLKSLLWDLDWRVRAAAVEALAKLEDRVPEEVIKDIAARLRDDDEDVRAAAVEALAVFKGRLPEEAIKDIAGLLRDDDKYVREAAVKALAKLEDRVPEEAIKDIAARLRDDNGEVRVAAVKALAKLEDRVPEEVIKDIAARLRDDERYERAAAVKALAVFKDRLPEEVIKDIAARLRDVNWEVRAAAVKALAVFKDRVPEEAIKDIAGWLRDDDRGCVRAHIER